MIIKDFSKQASILNHCIAELRDVQLQKDRRGFRENLENIGAILGYELRLQQTSFDIKSLHCRTSGCSIAERPQGLS